MIDFDLLKDELAARIKASDNPGEVLRAKELKDLYAVIPTLPLEERGDFGRKVNELKKSIDVAIRDKTEQLESTSRRPIDVTAPMDVNQPIPQVLVGTRGTTHPLMQEIDVLSEIFERMGFVIESSREIDDQYNMFEALNFPKDHPARDDYDTFMTVEKDSNGHPFIAPAHTSTMQNRILKKYIENLSRGEPIAAVVPDRVFRNEDLDARHEHTFYQFEGIYVDKGVHAGMLIATLKAFLSEYYKKPIEVQVNPYYFPFTEPSFEFALSCPFCEQKDPSCKVCSGEGWIELLGCGMIHPNVLRAAGIDPEIYTGFAWGGGIDRLVMMRSGIEDVRHFQSAKLDFLRQF